MDLYLATNNRHKLIEIRSIAEEFKINIIQLNEQKIEDKEKTIQEVALENAVRISNKLNIPAAVEDTGIFFKAYKDFPGANGKLVFNMIGYEGILKLMEGKNDRNAEFVSAIGYCEPRKKPLLFLGKLDAKVAYDVKDLDKDVMIYERILLLPDGRRLSTIEREEKNKISHRAKAFSKLFEYLTK